MRSSSSAAGRLATSASPTLVALTSSSRSDGRGGSTAADVSLPHSDTSRCTSDGGRVASTASQRPEPAACSVCSACRCVNDAAAVRPLHELISSSTRLGGRDVSVSSLAPPTARSTRSSVRCVNGPAIPVARRCGAKGLPTVVLTLSSCSDGGRCVVPSQTTASLQSSDTNALKCAKLACTDKLHPHTFSVRSEAGRRSSTSPVTSRQSRRSKRVTLASAATAASLSRAPLASLAPSAPGSAARHRTTSTTRVAASAHDTPATTPTTAACSRRSAPVSAVLRQERMAAPVTGLPASTRTSSGTSSTSTGAGVAAMPPVRCSCRSRRRQL